MDGTEGLITRITPIEMSRFPLYSIILPKFFTPCIFFVKFRVQTSSNLNYSIVLHLYLDLYSIVLPTVFFYFDIPSLFCAIYSLYSIYTPPLEVISPSDSTEKGEYLKLLKWLYYRSFWNFYIIKVDSQKKFEIKKIRTLSRSSRYRRRCMCEIEGWPLEAKKREIALDKSADFAAIGPGLPFIFSSSQRTRSSIVDCVTCII